MEHMTEAQILDKLLGADTLPEKTVGLERLGIPIRLRGLTSKEVNVIREQSTERSTRRGKEVERLDDDTFNASLITAATVSPNWGDQKLLAKFQASSGAEVIKRLLLAGEMAQLADVVLDLSGFHTELADIKN